MQTTYRNAGGHTLNPLPLKPVEIYVTDDLDYINPGDTVTGSDGSRFTVSEIRIVSGRLHRVILLPLEVTPCS